MPMVLSGLVVSYVFTFIISTSVPIISAAIHFAPLESNILANQHLAWLGVVFVASWVAIPSAIIIFLAGLTGIPTEVYEAASIDGATAWTKFRHVTFPLLFSFLVINTILSFKNFLNVYDIVVGLTGGGPGTATTSVAQTIFSGFFNGDYAYQMANAVIFFLITLLFAVVATIVTNVTAMALALALNAKIKWRAGLRTVFFMPMVISGLVISYVFTFILSNSVPIIAGAIHFAPLESSILANQHTAWLGIVLVASWVAIPGAIIIFLAGLVSIQPEVYEAASIDGASTWKQFQRMTFPLLFPFFVINTILTFKNFLNVYDICVGLTNGGPGTATTSVAQTIFSGFFTGDYAYQMANAVIFFFITLLFAIFQLGVIRRRGASL